MRAAASHGTKGAPAWTVGCGSKEVAASATEVVKAQLESFSVVVQKLERQLSFR